MDMIEYTDAKRVEERRRCILCGKDIVVESCKAESLVTGKEYKVIFNIKGNMHLDCELNRKELILNACREGIQNCHICSDIRCGDNLQRQRLETALGKLNGMNTLTEKEDREAVVEAKNLIRSILDLNGW